VLLDRVTEALVRRQRNRRDKLSPASSQQPIEVEARSLSKTFADGERRVEALRQVDLEVRRGDFLAIMGPSGSGKSTLLHLVGALDTPTSGTLMVGGERLGALSDNELTTIRSEQIGFVFQFFNLLPTLTAAENVLLPALIAGERSRQSKGRVTELLGLVGLAEREGHLPGELSGGEQQRVSLARALVRNPGLILADEPTGNLDTESGNTVLGLLRRIAREGQTVIMVTHDPVAASSADKIIFLRDGQRAGEIAGGDPQHAASYLSQLDNRNGDGPARRP